MIESTLNVHKVIGENKRDISILIIDDDSLILKTVTKILKKSNPRYYIQTAHTIEKAVDLLRETYWDTILLDISLPYKKGDNPDTENGLRALDTFINELNISAPIITMTGQHDDELSDIVLDKGAYYFLNKPLKPKSLAAIVKNATGFKMSGFDGLTGLLNRHTFEERLKSEFERVKRKNEENDSIINGIYTNSSKSFLSLLFLDGDNFKEINDRYNHLVGDHVLKKIGNAFIDDDLYKVLNKGDSFKYIIRPYDIAARFGGDEFSIFLPETDHHSALVVAKRIKSLLKKYNVSEIAGIEKSEDKVGISLSIGIATYPFPSNIDNYKDLMKMADIAMYASKEKRKGDIFGYNSEGIMHRLD